MNVVCSTDDNFVQHCSVMLTSVLLNNKAVVVWVLSEGLTPRNLFILREEVESKGGVFNYVQVDSQLISQLPMPNNPLLSHISPATYYRLLISDILPDTVDKVIYFDCDIVVRGSLKELWNSDISSVALSAVKQMWNEVEDATRLGYPIEFGYFNAGVLLVNLKYWREKDISQKLVSYLTENYDTILMHDQDALNAVLHAKAGILPCKWNMLHFFFYPDSRSITAVHNGKLINSYSDYKRQLIYSRRNPSVVHYVSKPKPWQHGCLHPFVKDYYDNAKRTKFFNNLKEPVWAVRQIEIWYNYMKLTVKWKLRPLYNMHFKRNTSSL